MKKAPTNKVDELRPEAAQMMKVVLDSNCVIDAENPRRSA